MPQRVRPRDTQTMLTHEDNGTKSSEDYRQYLYRLLGDEKAEYFLNPDSPGSQASCWYLQMIDGMGDHVSAEGYWDVLRQRSTSLMSHTTALQSMLERFCKYWDGDRDRGHMQHYSRVQLMFRSAQCHQVRASQLLTQNPVPLFHNGEGNGLSIYLAQDQAMVTGQCDTAVEPK